MYDYEYEEDVLISLQMLKYLYDNSPERFEDAIDMFREFDVDAFYMVADYAFWEIFHDGIAEQEEDSDFTVLHLKHPVFNRYLDMGWRWCEIHNCGINAWQKKIKDIVEYFAVSSSYSVFDWKVDFGGNSVQLELWLSPDFYEPMAFNASLLDLLLYVQRENACLEKELTVAEDETEMEAT
jgi:hypothetical protein